MPLRAVYPEIVSARLSKPVARAAACMIVAVPVNCERVAPRDTAMHTPGASFQPTLSTSTSDQLFDVGEELSRNNYSLDDLLL